METYSDLNGSITRLENVPISTLRTRSSKMFVHYYFSIVYKGRGGTCTGACVSRASCYMATRTSKGTTVMLSSLSMNVIALVIALVIAKPLECNLVVSLETRA